MAMRKLKSRLIKPGVKANYAKSTPLFRAAPAEPGRLIRTLDGKEERGAFADGAFQVLA